MHRECVHAMVSGMRALALTIAFAAALLPAVARANCAMPVGYAAAENPAGRVTVCLQNYAQRSCPDQGLLRERVDTGELVLLSTCNAAGCFVDECVPGGSYRYGLATPYACERGACTTDYFAVVATPGAPAGCVRSGAAPVAAASAAPWSGKGERVCSYAGPGGESSQGCISAGPVFAGNALLLVAGAGLWARRRRRAQRG